MVAPGRLLGHRGCSFWQPVVVCFVLFFVSTTRAYVGLNYGRNGNNLPAPSQTVQLVQSLGVSQVRLYDTDPTVLSAFQNSNVQLVLGVLNSEILDLATSNTSAPTWVTTKVLPFVNSTNILAIAVGNEVLTGFPSAASSLVPAMTNLYGALVANNLANIRVSSPCSMELLAQSYVPSSGEFNGSYSEISDLLAFLSQTSAPFMINVYPYKAYTAEPATISLDYALFTTNSSSNVLDTGSNQTYTNLFDAQVDAVYAALARSNHSDVDVLVSETGWPTAGDLGESGASPQNAQTYNGNLVKRLGERLGTPVRPGVAINAFLYEIYNEDLNVGPSSQRNFGMFANDSTPLYAVNFTGSGDNSTGAGGQRTWCIAKQGLSEAVLQTSIDFACGVGNANCSAIQANGACFLPDTRYSHASFAMNLYYVNSTDPVSACNFQGAAQVVAVDPSYGSCIYPASVSATPVTNAGTTLTLASSPTTRLLFHLVVLSLAVSFWR